MTRARILLAVLEDFPGSENRVQRQAAALAAAGHEVTVYCASGPSACAEWRGIPIVRSRLRREKSYSARRRLEEYSIFPLELRRWLADEGESFDIVQVANPPDWLALAAARWRRSMGGRLVLDIHDPMPELMTAKGGGPLAAVLAWLEGISARRADLVIAATPGVARAVEGRHGVPVTAIVNAVDTDAVTMRAADTNAWAAHPVRLVYLGTMTHRFGVQTAVDATRELIGRGADVRLDLYGSGDEEGALKRSAADLADAVKFHGQIPASDVPAALDGAAIGLVPYRDSAFMRLAYSTKAFEYAALGIPSVCSDLPSLREQMGEASEYAPSQGAVAWADAIERLLTDRSRWERLAVNGSALISSVNWSGVSQEYVRAVIGSLGGGG